MLAWRARASPLVSDLQRSSWGQIRAPCSFLRCCCHANTPQQTSCVFSGGGGGHGRGQHTVSSGDDGQPISSLLTTLSRHLMWGCIVYALFLGWTAICTESFEQFMLSKALNIPGASDWKVSIIIPVLNEAQCIGDTIRWLRANLEGGAGLEILVVDGGSSDRTVAAAKQAGATRVLRPGVKGRAAQMNVGAKAATGEVLVFLHADTQPPAGLVSCLRSKLADPRIVLVGFHVKILDSSGREMRFLTWHNRNKTWLYPWLMQPFNFMLGQRLMFGDQVLSCRWQDFKQTGFDSRLRIMEDADLCLKLHHEGPAPAYQHGYQGRGRAQLVTEHVASTSGRRLEAWGPLWATYVHFRIALAWYLGASVERQAELYQRLYTDGYR